MKRYADRPEMKKNTLLRAARKIGYSEAAAKALVQQIMEKKTGSVEAMKLIHSASTRATTARHLNYMRKKKHAAARQHRRL